MEYSMNDAIKSYCEFLEKYFKNPNDFTFKASVQLLNAYCNSYKDNESDYYWCTRNMSWLITESRNDLEFIFLEKEQVWAVIHLMIESIAGQTLNIFKQRRRTSCMRKFQYAMSQLWVTKHERDKRRIFL